MPSLFLAPIGGVIVDRAAKRHMLIATQTGLAIQAAILGLLTIHGIVQLYQIILLAIIAGVLMAIDMPAPNSVCSPIVSRRARDSAS